MSEDRIRVEVDDILSDLVPRYLGNRETDVELIRTALEVGDWDLPETIGHKMKGSGGGYGFDRITELGEIIESGSQRRDIVYVTRAVDELDDYLHRVEPVFIDEE